MNTMPVTSSAPATLAAAEERLRVAAIAFRAAVVYEAQRRAVVGDLAGTGHDSFTVDDAITCGCRACVAADELNTAALEYAELKEAN